MQIGKKKKSFDEINIEREQLHKELYSKFEMKDLSVFKKERFKFFKHIKYDDKYHTYLNTLTKEEYKSVTKLLGSLKEKFEPDAYNTAKTMDKYLMTFEEVVEYWKKNNEWANNKGTYLHYLIEELVCTDLTLEEIIETFKLDNLHIKYLTYVNNLGFKELRQKGICRPESIVFLDEYKISGQSDIVLEYDNYIDIEDWKTNSKPLTEVFIKNGKPKKLKTPFTDMEASDLNIYTLQLSVYAYAEKLRTEKRINKLRLHHFYEGEVITYEPEYNEENVLKLLKTIK